MKTLLAIDYAQQKPTRDYVQDIAKVIGKTQQLFLPADPHEYQKGLVVSENGLSSQAFQINGHQELITLDVKTGQLKTAGNSWQLGTQTGQAVLNELQAWLTDQGFDKDIPAPEFTAHEPVFGARQGETLARMLSWANQQLQQCKANLQRGITGPVLLYPHHFDVSLSWFPASNDEPQVTFGFSTGDETIQEPYFYVTAYPEPAGFSAIHLPVPADWQSKDFSGAVVRYNRLTSIPNPEDALQKIFAVIRAIFDNPAS